MRLLRVDIRCVTLKQHFQCQLHAGNLRMLRRSPADTSQTCSSSTGPLSTIGASWKLFVSERWKPSSLSFWTSSLRGSFGRGCTLFGCLPSGGYCPLCWSSWRCACFLGLTPLLRGCAILCFSLESACFCDKPSGPELNWESPFLST